MLHFTVQWCLSAQMATAFACSFNIFYIYQAFILFFHKALHPPSLFLSLSVHLSLSVVPHPVFPISGFSLRFGDVDVFFLQSKVICCYSRTCLGRPPLLPNKNGRSRQVVSHNRSYKNHILPLVRYVYICTHSQAVVLSETGVALV